MTKPVNRPYKKRGRAPKVPPANAARRIAALAASGHSVIGIARGLGTSPDTLRRWLDEDPALAEALAHGREAERLTLHNALYRAARKGNIIAAMFLLKARHGYREGDQGWHLGVAVNSYVDNSRDYVITQESQVNDVTALIRARLKDMAAAGG
jgi:lambda repressor-like predicted transcriptional regulator